MSDRRFMHKKQNLGCTLGKEKHNKAEFQCVVAHILCDEFELYIIAATYYVN